MCVECFRGCGTTYRSIVAVEEIKMAYQPPHQQPPPGYAPSGHPPPMQGYHPAYAPAPAQQQQSSNVVVVTQPSAPVRTKKKKNARGFTSLVRVRTLHDSIECIAVSCIRLQCDSVMFLGFFWNWDN